MTISFPLRGFFYATLAIATATNCLAQNMGNGGTTFSSLESATKPEAFLGKFVDLAHADMDANAKLLQALHETGTAKQAMSGVQTPDMNATTSDLANSVAAASKVHEALIQSLGKHIVLTESEKADFLSGAVALTKAAMDFTALTRNIGATKQVLMTAGAPARVALYAARATPEMASQLRTEVKAVANFAKMNQIVLPPEFTSASEVM
jgi:hypothetical protein